LPQAVDDYTAALALDSTNYLYMSRRSQCYHQLGNPTAAEEDLNQAINIQPRDAQLYYLRALARYDQDNFEGTITDLETALDEDIPPETHADVYYHIGLAAANSDKHEEAVPAFTAALAARPQPAPHIRMLYVHERAKSRQMIGEVDGALEDFTAVIDVCPRHAHALFRRGFAWKAKREYERAADDFEAAKAADPGNPHLVVNYSQLHEVECIVLCAAGEEPDFCHPDDAADDDY
jgi:tetratricopeptide (TPR) repeat protein